MKNLELITKELAGLVADGMRLIQEGQTPQVNIGAFGPKYEIWYTKALAAVTQVIPERLPEFRGAYREEKRRDISFSTFAISDFLLGMRVTRAGTPVFDTMQAFAGKMLRQVGIVIAATEAAPSVLRDIRATLRAEILDSDILAARDLLKAGHIRSAGVVCGVVLETHLRGICDRRGLTIAKKDPGIADLNELLKGGRVYDVPMWRLVQRLADIRNLCGHRKDRDPKVDEVEDLIAGTDKVTKEIA